MGWSVGYDTTWGRFIGYGVPAVCDHPECSEAIDRGLSYVCGGGPYGGEHGCGLYFCSKHRFMPSDMSAELCERCLDGAEPFDAKPDTPEWMRHQLTDDSWQGWREEHPELALEIARALDAVDPHVPPRESRPRA